MILAECTYEISAPEVVAEDFEGEIVVLNLLNGKYFSLLGPTADLWRDISQGHRPSDLLQRVAASGCDTESLSAILGTLIGEQLIRPAAENGNAEVPAVDTARVLPVLLAGMPLPAIEAFDDMSELILADPIHDVEEDIGWPVKRSPVAS